MMLTTRPSPNSLYITAVFWVQTRKLSIIAEASIMQSDIVWLSNYE